MFNFTFRIFYRPVPSNQQSLLCRSYVKNKWKKNPSPSWICIVVGLNCGTTDRWWDDDDERQEETHFHNCGWTLPTTTCSIHQFRFRMWYKNPLLYYYSSDGFNNTVTHYLLMPLKEYSVNRTIMRDSTTTPQRTNETNPHSPVSWLDKRILAMDFRMIWIS